MVKKTATVQWIEKIIGQPKHTVEVAACRPEVTKTRRYVMHPDCRAQLFEPHPGNFALLEAEYGGLRNVELHNVAVADHDGTATLCCPADGLLRACHLEGVYAPAVFDQKVVVTDRVEVQCRRFDQFDDGTIDFILIDCEGSEWSVIQRMVSRPKLIQVEMALKWGYRNPHILDLKKWMHSEGYVMGWPAKPGRDWMLVRE